MVLMGIEKRMPWLSVATPASLLMDLHNVLLVLPWGNNGDDLFFG
jgi:hypothetical protein